MLRKLRNKLPIFLILSLNLNAFAGDVVYVPKNTPAPDDGYFFPADKAQEAKKAIIERDGLQQINLSLQNENNLLLDNQKQLQQKFGLSDTRADALAKQLDSQKTMNDWEKVMWFGIGVLGTGLAAYGISRATR